MASTDEKGCAGEHVEGREYEEEEDTIVEVKMKERNGTGWTAKAKMMVNKHLE